MDVMKLVGLALISTILCLIIKKDRPEMAMFIGILTGIMILLSVTYKFNFIIESINELANKANIPTMYISLIIKLIGIAYLMEFAIQICKDCGEGNIAAKLEFGGKIIVMTMSFPILISIVDMILNLIP
ncbi:MAG: stage III sporulation protein AD [Paraclostridium bifermentans]|uniref:Stage III sporulation protein AD n=3 Tax=Bacillota TaxID=1239 RepID=A0A1X2JIV5_PARBF|nr:stage III sporulation protein AD [[Clostridium] bifermentans ATCC 638] [Paraclostridium bifermentans ATCC 638 = DSM 14991]EQK45209.1 stage III sporulation protein AD [[Clostridium] bifermentans ATCC 19299] [Paraclostridium bifermentans ATCC 19299]KGJ50299.1 stage III sporulation protein AD [Clostridium sp. NCR]MBN8048382.1 stage III sporulation protein AD [Paraclostridium bifermentans]RDC51204.1 stage III sporulation protein AD [Acinetobacter sp. RIT592]